MADLRGRAVPSSRTRTSSCCCTVPKYYDQNDQPGIAEVIVAKNRNGATGKVSLTFLKNITRFENTATVGDAIEPGVF